MLEPVVIQAKGEGHIVSAPPLYARYHPDDALYIVHQDYLDKTLYELRVYADDSKEALRYIWLYDVSMNPSPDRIIGAIVIDAKRTCKLSFRPNDWNMVIRPALCKALGIKLDFFYTLVADALRAPTSQP